MTKPTPPKPSPEKAREYQVTYRLRRVGVPMDRKARRVDVPATAKYVPQVWAWIRELQALGWTVQQTVPDPPPATGRIVYVYDGDQKDRGTYGGMRCRMLSRRKAKAKGRSLVRFDTGEVAEVRTAYLRRLDELPADVVRRLPDPAARFDIRLLATLRPGTRLESSR